LTLDAVYRILEGLYSPNVGEVVSSEVGSEPERCAVLGRCSRASPRIGSGVPPSQRVGTANTRLILPPVLSLPYSSKVVEKLSEKPHLRAKRLTINRLLAT
jgi:hypothetical protein